MPSGTPMRIARPKPLNTRLSVATVLSISPRSLKSTGTLRSTSPGLGSSTGEMTRVSALAPRVSTHQMKIRMRTPSAPKPRRNIGGGSLRRVIRSRNDCATMSPDSLRLEGVNLDLDAPVLGGVSRVARIGGLVPSLPDRGELIGLQRWELP